MTFKLDQRDRIVAEAQSAELARLGQTLLDASWAIDSELSGYDKDAAGYRTRNAANTDGGDNFSEADFTSARADARALLASANGLQDLLAKRVLLAEQARLTERATRVLDFETPSTVPLVKTRKTPGWAWNRLRKGARR